MNFRSIKVRLMAGYTALMLAAAVLLGMFAYVSLKAELLASLRQTQLRRIERIKSDILPGLTGPDAGRFRHQIEQVYVPVESNRLIRVSRDDGTVLYQSGAPTDGSFDPADVPVAGIPAGQRCLERLLPAHNQEIQVSSCTAEVSGEHYTIEIGTPTGQGDTITRRLLISMLTGLPLLILVAAIAGARLIRGALRPVEEVRLAAERITLSNLTRRLPVIATGDAVEALTRTLNTMLERLDQSYQQARRFSADASHELRTPLTVMRSELQSVALRSDLSQECRTQLNSIVSETERLSAIVEALFAVARLDSGEANVAHNVVDLHELTATTLDQMRLLADEKLITVEMAGQGPAKVMGDMGRLKQAVVNLLDNAIKYTNRGGLIRVFVETSAGRTVLRVADNGIGIPSEALTHVFDRFYRANNARAMCGDGAGLGLSIVQSIAIAHGGSVTINSVAGNGTTVALSLPRLVEDRPVNQGVPRSPPAANALAEAC